MAESKIDILIRARDEASKTIEVTSRQMGSLAASSRFAAVSIVHELSPALGSSISQLTSLASTAALSGTAMGALATVGIGGLVVALGQFITKAREAEKVQRELTQAVAMGQVPRIQKELNDLREKERAILAQSFDLQVTGFENTAGLREDALAAIRNEIELRERQIQHIHQSNIEGARRVEQLNAETEVLKKRADLEDASIRRSASAAAVEGRRRIEAEHEINEEALGAFEAFLVAKESAARESARRQLEINAKSEGDLQRAAVEAEGEIAENMAAAVSAAQMEFEERTLESIRRSQQPITNAMTTLGHASADALFDALSGRARTLGDALKSLFDGLARDIFRNTLSTLFGGQEQGLSLQNLLSLGGGGGPLGRTAMAAGVPFGGSFAQQGFDLRSFLGFGQAPISFAGTTVPTADILREGLPTGLTGAQMFGGGLLVAGGALGLLGASQARDPLSGGIAGGLGGYALGSGLGTLFQAGSYIPYIGAAFAVAGLAYGFISGQSAKRKRKREEARQRRIQEQVQAITAGLEGVDTLEELEAVSADLLAGISAPVALRPAGLPLGPAGFPGTRRIGLEPEARKFLREAMRQRAGPLIQAFEAKRTAEARGLTDIEALIAQGISPDIPGAAEIVAGRIRRRQEILAGLEEIGGISIDEQLEGGIRRRTLVGAGAFGLSRAAQAGVDVTADLSRFRRMLRMGLLEDRALLEQLLFRLRSIGQSIDLQIGDLGALN